MGPASLYGAFFHVKATCFSYHFIILFKKENLDNGSGYTLLKMREDLNPGFDSKSQTKGERAKRQ